MAGHVFFVKMSLEKVIEEEATKYQQKFLVVHVIYEEWCEPFMITKLENNFVEQQCYNIPTFIEMLNSRNIVPKKIGITNSPFVGVSNWITL